MKKMHIGMFCVLIAILSVGCAHWMKTTQRDIANSNDPGDGYVKVSEHLQGIRQEIADGKQVLSCRSRLGRTALEEGVRSTIFSFDPKSKEVRFSVNNLKEDFVISLDEKLGAEISTGAEYSGHGGFTASNSECVNGHKKDTIMYYVVQNGPGIIGSKSPLADLSITQTRRETLQRICSDEAIKNCECGADSGYVERETISLSCELYASPFSPVSGQFSSNDLQELYKIFFEAKQFSKKNDGEEIFDSSDIQKLQVDGRFLKTMTTSMLWSSVPTLAKEEVLSTLFVRLSYEKKASEIMFNPSFSESAVRTAVSYLEKNSSLKFYQFGLDDFRGEHKAQVNGWLIADTITGEILVANRTQNLTLMKEIYLKKPLEKTANVGPSPNFSPTTGARTRNRTRVESCEGQDVSYLPPENVPNCWEKNNASFVKKGFTNDVTVNKLATWFDVHSEFINGSELNANTHFEAPGVCYDLDGNPKNSDNVAVEMGATKRTPIYMIKDGLNVSLYTHQVLQKTNHGIWPPGKKYCEGKELEYKRAAHNILTKIRFTGYSAESIELTDYPQQCFTHYRGFVDLAVNQGPTHLLLRQTDRGIVMLWPRPQDPLVNLEHTQVMCVFSKKALKRIEK